MDKNPNNNVEDFAHGTALTSLCKVIMMCEMDEEIKKVMLLRVWGPDPKVFNPLTPREVAYLRLNCRRPPEEFEVQKVRDLEESGKFQCEQFLLSMNSQEIVDSFNKDFSKNTGRMFGNQNYERKKFQV